MTQMFDKFIEEREDPVKAQAVNEGVCVCVSICTLSMCPFVLYQCVHLYFINVSICTLSMCPFVLYQCVHLALFQVCLK